MRTIHALALASTLLALGCDDGGGGTDAGRDGGTGEDACAACASDTGTPDSGGPIRDGNDSFATADPIVIGAEEPTTGVINPAEDVDFYTFEGTEGQWLWITTDANPTGDIAMVDTVLTLYDASMTQIAENDDAQPRFSPDSELITRLPATGTYYLRVQEFSTWMPEPGEPAEGMDSFTYELSVNEVDDSLTVWTVDAETGDDAASAQPLTGVAGGGSVISYIAGSFDDATDVDVYSLRLPPGGPYAFTVYLMPTGADGYGSTVEPATIWITNGDGTQIVARLTPTVTGDFSPIMSAGEYLVFTEHGATAGANDFYVYKAFRRAAGRELMETTNDLVATPEPLTFEEPTEDDPVPSAFIVGTLADGDTDHFSFTANAGELLSVACGSRTAGSGIVDLTAALLDPADITGATTLATDTETATEGVFIEDFAITTTGTYVVRITKGSQDPEVTGVWYRCGVHRAPPAP